MKALQNFINENKIDNINIYLSYYDKDELIKGFESLIDKIKNNDIKSIDFIHDDKRNFVINLNDDKESIEIKNKYLKK